MLQRADAIKTADNGEFIELLKRLDGQAERLTPLQHDYLDYLKGWQTAYRGDYVPAVPMLEAVLARTQDPTLRARVRISLLNDHALARHFEEAYAHLSVLLESLPQLADPTARNLSYGVASLLYNQAGQYDLALHYADLWLADPSDTSHCKAMTQKLQSLQKLGKLVPDDPQVQAGIDACDRIGDPVFGNNARAYVAQALIEQGHAAEALRLLKPHDAEVVATHSAGAISNFRAALARSYLLTGDLPHARESAQSAVDYGIKQAYSQSVTDAYQVLYEAARQQGDLPAALTYHEKYAAAADGYLRDAAASALAFQMVHQQVLDKKRQIDALSDANQVLRLKQQVTGLYVVLLAAVLGSVAWWAWRTKLSQLRFQKLARRDSLTGIFNRQHFLDAATIILRYGSKSARDACLLVIDLDNFKTVNDTYGHATGDMVLKRAVSACERHLRSIDLFGRLGGEEFGILLTDCTVQDAVRRAEQLRVAIAGLCGDEGQMEFPVSASFGIAATAASGYDLTQLLMDADHALYRAKREGRNRVALFQSEPVGASAHAT